MFVQAFNYNVKGPVVLLLFFHLASWHLEFNQCPAVQRYFEVCQVLIEVEVPETKLIPRATGSRIYGGKLLLALHFNYFWLLGSSYIFRVAWMVGN